MIKGEVNLTLPEKKDPKRHLSYEGRYRLETTVWDKCNYDQKNHVYITSGSTLIGYVALYGPDAYKEVRFGTPLRQWSVSRRKFRDLTKKEIASLQLGKHLHSMENGVMG